MFAGFVDALTGKTPPPPCYTDGGQRSPFTVALVAIVVLGFLHAQRLAWALLSYRQYGPDFIIREVVITVVSGVALSLFWNDVRSCRFYEGVLRLVMIEAFANALLPCLWVIPRRKEKKEKEEASQ